MDSTPQEYDVVVLGTGAAGLTAAIAEADAGARVAVFEKAEKVGGTAAWSGGMVWVPQNAHMAELGLSDSREQAMTLPDVDVARAHGRGAGRRVRRCRARGRRAAGGQDPGALQIIHDFPDYHPERSGAARAGGRSLECPLFPFDERGTWQDRATVGRSCRATSS